MVYVDNARAAYGRMVMCHMLADTSAELHAMADRIGVSRRWCQFEGTPREHYDVCLAKRRLAIEAGAVPVRRERLVQILRQRQFEAAKFVSLPLVREGGPR